MTADDPQPFVTDSEVLQKRMRRYLASGRWELGREVILASQSPCMAGSNPSMRKTFFRRPSWRTAIPMSVPGTSSTLGRCRGWELVESSRRTRTSTDYRALTGWTPPASGNGRLPSPPGKGSLGLQAVVGDEVALTYTVPMPNDGVTRESASVLDFVQSGPANPTRIAREQSTRP